MGTTKFRVNQKVQVSGNAPFHAGRVGYVHYPQTAGDVDACVVLRAQMKDGGMLTFFAVHPKHLSVVPT